MAARKRTFSRRQSVRWSLFQGTVGDTNILFSIDPSPKGYVGGQEDVVEVLHRIALLDTRLHTYPPDAPTIGSGQKHGGPQELPVVRSRLGSVPWPVRPAKQPQGGTGDPAAPPPDY